MKVVILCGGKGTRIKEMAEEIPKHLIEIGGQPVLWHIMKIYSYYGFKDFILCLGYKGDKIKDFFLKYKLKNNDFSIKNGKMCIHTQKTEDWNITFVDTGEDSTKLERLLKIRKYLDKDKEFFVTYGDDVSDVDIKRLLDFHREQDKIATITAFQINSPFGVMKIDEKNLITEFKEKPLMENWVNGGFMILNKKIFDYIKPKEELEREVFERLARMRQISAFKHYGFWKSMNTIKDAQELNELWKDGRANWKVWE